MIRFLRSRKALAVLALAGLVVGAFYCAWILWFRFPPSAELAPFVKGRPGVPIVFTSRTSPASLEAPAPEGEGFHYPGQLLWTASEGRLRRLDPDGRVYELTWGRTLSDGSTLIDVMSPCVSLDGTRVLFAGRKAPPDPGRFRIFQVDVDGSDLKQITGTEDDPGCSDLPPLRFASDGSAMSAEDRRRVDYDDVDPTERGDGGIVFASSRTPDLGRGHSRRSTQLWQLSPGAKAPTSLTANRNNDRWPSVIAQNFILFSMWSRNREAISADRRDVVPWTADGTFANRPTDVWMGVRVKPDGDVFGYTLKIDRPVWRQRALFNGKIAFMTPGPSPGRMQIAQGTMGLLRVAPSSLAASSEIPLQGADGLEWGPSRDADGRELSAATPSAHPGNRIVFAGAPIGPNGSVEPASYGLYACPDDWSSGEPIAAQPLFDDPRLVDAEPVAVFERDYPVIIPPRPKESGRAMPNELVLLNGHRVQGPFGFSENIISFASTDPPPAQKTDAGEQPIFPAFTNVQSIAVFMAKRDRFDDPKQLRSPGSYERVLKVPVEKSGPGAAMRLWLPTDAPHVLAGLDADGKIARLDSTAKDSRGRSGTFYAIAGDHYSGSKPEANMFCLGCHTGHTFARIDVTEKVK